MPDRIEANLDEEELRARVTLIDERTVLYREAPVYTDRGRQIMKERADQLVAHLDSFRIIVDITDMTRPSAREREKIRQSIQGNGKLERLVVVTGANVVARMAMKFLFGAMGHFSWSCVGSLDEALDELGIDRG